MRAREKKFRCARGGVCVGVIHGRAGDGYSYAKGAVYARARYILSALRWVACVHVISDLGASHALFASALGPVNASSMHGLHAREG